VKYKYVGAQVAQRKYPTPDVTYEPKVNNYGWGTDHRTHKNSTDIVNYAYLFNDNGNITKQTYKHRTSDPASDFTYDDLDRLTIADYHDSDKEEFTLDDLGNRTQVEFNDTTTETYAVDNLTNRYDKSGTYDIQLTYDDAGNLTTDKDSYTYHYDYENRLAKVKKTSDTVDVVTYTYDALGRRIEVNDVVASRKTRYYYNNNWQVLCEKDDTGSTQRRYIYGNYIDEVLMIVDVVANPDVDYYYAHDHLYSPAALLGSDGTVLERYEYDAYGSMTRLDPNFTTWSGTEAGNPYYFTGRRVDVLDSGSLKLQYSRNRYYDYYTGRWLKNDPLGYTDGMNLYEYVQSNPVLLLDAWGLYKYKLLSPEFQGPRLEDSDYPTILIQSAADYGTTNLRGLPRKNRVDHLKNEAKRQINNWNEMFGMPSYSAIMLTRYIGNRQPSKSAAIIDGYDVSQWMSVGYFPMGQAAHKYPEFRTMLENSANNVKQAIDANPAWMLGISIATEDYYGGEFGSFTDLGFALGGFSLWHKAENIKCNEGGWITAKFTMYLRDVYDFRYNFLSWGHEAFPGSSSTISTAELRELHILGSIFYGGAREYFVSGTTSTELRWKKGSTKKLQNLRFSN